jgi:hypothetical protein
VPSECHQAAMASALRQCLPLPPPFRVAGGTAGWQPCWLESLSFESAFANPLRLALVDGAQFAFSETPPIIVVVNLLESEELRNVVTSAGSLILSASPRVH